MKHILKKILLFTFIASAGYLSAYAQKSKIVRISAYGDFGDSKKDMVPIIDKILKEYKSSGPVTLLFEKGRYDFWSEGIKSGSDKPTIAFDLDGMNDVTIDGNSCEFVFHGKMMPFRIYRSQNISLRNFSIDWDRPYNSQARITEATDSYVDMEIDRREYPYEVVNDTIFFLGEGWRSTITPEYTNLYDKDTKDLVYQTRDRPMGNGLYSAKVSELGKDKVRFHFKPDIKPEPGTITVFFHGRYITNGIEVMESKNTHLENLTIYHTLSCGVSGYRSENISLRHVHIINNDNKGRAFSTVADATHFNGCKGEILFDNCSVSGAGDDFMNIHGMYSYVKEILSRNSLLVAPNGRYIGFDKGETAWVLDSLTMQRGNELIVTNQERVFDDQQKLKGYAITFSSDINGKVKKGDLLENKDRNPSLTVRNCSMLKKNRGRSILVTTAGNVLIEDNYFNSAGAAVLIEGDTDLWYESGAVRNVIIRNNIFDNCYTSGNNILDKPWGWGEAVISITPSVEPTSENFPAYHSNIRIENNIFKHFDYALLFARAADKLTFKNNIIEKTDAYKPFYRKANIYLDGCRNVKVENNRFDEDFPGKNIVIKNMRRSDVSQESSSTVLNVMYE